MRPRRGVVNGPPLTSSFGAWGKATRTLDERQCNKFAMRPVPLPHNINWSFAVKKLQGSQGLNVVDNTHFTH